MGWLMEGCLEPWSVDFPYREGSCILTKRKVRMLQRKLCKRVLCIAFLSGSARDWVRSPINIQIGYLSSLCKFVKLHGNHIKHHILEIIIRLLRRPKTI